MEEKLLELIQKIAEVKGDSNAEVELENKIAFETGKMEGLSLTEKESIVNTIAAKLGGELYTNIFFAFWSWIVTEQNSYLMKQVKELINSSNITWQEKYYLADQINLTCLIIFIYGHLNWKSLWLSCIIWQSMRENS